MGRVLNLKGSQIEVSYFGDDQFYKGFVVERFGFYNHSRRNSVFKSVSADLLMFSQYGTPNF